MITSLHSSLISFFIMVFCPAYYFAPSSYVLWKSSHVIGRVSPQGHPAMQLGGGSSSGRGLQFEPTCCVHGNIWHSPCIQFFFTEELHSPLLQWFYLLGKVPF